MRPKLEFVLFALAIMIPIGICLQISHDREREWLYRPR